MYPIRQTETVQPIRACPLRSSAHVESSAAGCEDLQGSSLGRQPPSKKSVIPIQHPRTYATLRLLLRPIFRAYFGMSGTGVDHIPRNIPFILAYNHVSMLDWAFASYFMPVPLRFVVDRDYFDHPLLRLLMR